jgi:hypothetical protein
MKYYLAFLALLAVSLNGFSQHRFVVQNIDTTMVYPGIETAFNNARHGDTVYIPGGVFDVSGIAIDKKLTIYGVGHYPDSTKATYHTQLNGHFSFIENSDTSFISGIYFRNNLQFGTSTYDVKNITIERCRVGGTLALSGDADDIDINFVITESVLNAVDGNYARNILFKKCLIHGMIYEFNFSVFLNNCINSRDNSYSRVLRTVNECLFKNNVFAHTKSGSFDYAENCSFEYNLFAPNVSFPNGTNTGSNNIVNIPTANIYTDLSGSSEEVHLFSYDNDYHLQSTGIGAGSDGNNIGIYGTDIPYKDGAVPSTPHIQEIDIAPEAENGLLPVRIKVRAQNR